jgi:hypothetical protein
MEPIWHILFAIQLNALFFTTDNLNNIYVVKDNYSVVKYDSAGTKLFSYEVKANGQPTSMDVSNPMKLMVYYKDYSTVVLLDNTLSEISKINLSAIGIVQPSAACLSSDGNIWVYDETENRLKKIDAQLKVVAESELLNGLSEKNIQPQMMVEENNLLYVSDSTQGIFVFDGYGAFSNKITLKGVGQFQVVNGNIFFLKGILLHYYSKIILTDNIFLTLPELSLIHI